MHPPTGPHANELSLGPHTSRSEGSADHGTIGGPQERRPKSGRPPLLHHPAVPAPNPPGLAEPAGPHPADQSRADPTQGAAAGDAGPEPDEDTVHVIGQWHYAERGHSPGEAAFARTIGEDFAENRLVWRLVRSTCDD